MKLLFEHTVYLTGAVQAIRYSVQSVGAATGRTPISPDMPRIVYVRNGHCDWIISGRSYPVGAGDVVMLNNTEKRCQTGIDGAEPVVQDVIRFMPVAFPSCSRCLPVFFDRKPSFSNVLTGEYPGKEVIIGLINLMQDEAGGEGPERDTAMLAVMQLLLISIYRTCSALGMTGNGRNDVNVSSGNYQLICDSVNYIKDNLTDDISVALLARHAGISRSYYSRMFHAIMGMSVPQYVRVRRIVRVNESKKAGESVTDAVFAAGFGSLSAYYKALCDLDHV